MFLKFRRCLIVLFAILLPCVSPGTWAQSQQNLVGFWWKPAESGWGVAVHQMGDTTFAVWFTYDAQGAAIWYTLTCTFAGSTCSGDLYTASGTPLLQITGSANTVLRVAGTGTLTTSGTNRLSLRYTVGNTTQTKPDLERHDFAAAGQVPFCSMQAREGPLSRAGLTNYTDQWWGGSEASGWGLQISHQGATVFGGWYTYNAQGTATWLTAQGTHDPANARRFTGSLYAVNPGIPFALINGPIAQSSVIFSGTFELNFTDGERGTFTWSIPVAPDQPPVVRPLPIQRFAVAGGALNVCTVATASTVSGRVVSSENMTAAVAGARIVDRQTNAVLATTDSAGNFQINGLNAPVDVPLYVSISAEGYLTRETGLRPGMLGVVADIIRLSPPFSLKYYRELVRPGSDGSDQKPGFGLVGWRGELMNVYIRTNLVNPTDRTRPPIDTGVAVSQEVINRVLTGLEKTRLDIAGGTVKIGRVESGPGVAHEGEPGWLAIDFFDRVTHPQPDYAGFGGTGLNGYANVRLGVHASASIDCAPMSQGLAMHELGHVFGLLHAQLDTPNLMNGGGVNMPCADAYFSPAERLHGRIAFSRPRGNEDPDRDPAGFVLPGVAR